MKGNNIFVIFKKLIKERYRILGKLNSKERDFKHKRNWKSDYKLVNNQIYQMASKLKFSHNRFLSVQTQIPNGTLAFY